MSEIPFFFDGRSARLFGVLHENGPARGVPFVFCHPFGEEKLWTHRVFVSFARRLAQRGHPVLRFDYTGNGDSEGDFSATSVTTTEADIQTAIEMLKARLSAPRVALLGLRLGATLAARVADARDDVDRLVLWSPITDGHRYMQDLLRINVTTQMAVYKAVRLDREQLAAELRAGSTVNVDGYEIGGRFFEELSALSLTGARRFGGRCLIVQADRPGAKPMPDLQQLGASYGAVETKLVEESPFWKEIDRFYDAAPNLFAATEAWLEAAA
jgi:exosortase A-associated hydrolase 2